MSFLTLLNLLGFGFGSVLSVILLSLSQKKKPVRFDDYSFGLLIVAAGIWLSASFFTILLQSLFGSVAMPAAHFFRQLALFGLIAMPSALLHVYLLLLFRIRSAPGAPLRARQRAVLALMHVPVPVFSIAAFTLFHADREVLVRPLLLWITLAITASVTISEKLVRILPQGTDRRFHRDVNYSLAGIGLGVILLYLLPIHRLGYVGDYLNLVLEISPLIPMSILAYYVFRYNFYRLVIKPSFVYSIIYGLVMAIYLLGIRRIGEYLRQFPEINSALIEGLLLVALVFAFQPFRTKIQARLDEIFFKDRAYYQRFLRELSNSISGIVDLEKLLTTIANALTSALGTRSCTLIVFSKTESSPRYYQTGEKLPLKDLDGLREVTLQLKGTHLRQHLSDPRMLAALAANQLELAVPVIFKGELIGLICLAAKKRGNSYSGEEIDLLQTFANQIGLAMENARLVQERLLLEARIYHSERLNSLGQLATALAHEIKNPLSSIKAIVQVLNEKASGEAERDLSLVITEIDRLNQTLEKLLSFSRPAELELEPIELDRVIEDVIALLSHQARRSQVRLEFKSRSGPISTYGRKGVFRETVFNLVLNAIQALPGGGRVRITLQLDPLSGVDPGRRQIRMIVEDSGPGVPPHLREKIFEPFWSSKSVGTGLGLAIVRRNVDAVGGSIELRSEGGKGAAFHITIPQQRRKHESRGTYSHRR